MLKLSAIQLLPATEFTEFTEFRVSLKNWQIRDVNSQCDEIPGCPSPLLRRDRSKVIILFRAQRSRSFKSTKVNSIWSNRSLRCTYSQKLLRESEVIIVFHFQLSDELADRVDHLASRCAVRSTMRRARCLKKRKRKSSSAIYPVVLSPIKHCTAGEGWLGQDKKIPRANEALTIRKCGVTRQSNAHLEQGNSPVFN